MQQGLRTIWDIEKDGGDSSVQVFGSECVKLYPADRVSESQLNVYHSFQSSLGFFEFPIEDHVLTTLGFQTIRFSFINLSESEISKASDLKLKRDIYVTQVSFVNGLGILDSDYGRYILREIRDFTKYHNDPRIRYLQGTIYAQNLKLISSDNGIIEVVCTDAFGDIPQMVDTLLSLNFEW